MQAQAAWSRGACLLARSAGALLRSTHAARGWPSDRIVTRRASGSDLDPEWPEVRLAGADERRGAEGETYDVTLRSDGDVFTYEPSTAAEFAAFAVGSQWTVTVSGLGAIVAVEPAR